MVATAHKIARIVYKMLKYKVEYDPVSAQEYDDRFRERQIKYLKRKAQRLGFTLVSDTGEAEISAVS